MLLNRLSIASRLPRHSLGLYFNAQRAVALPRSTANGQRRLVHKDKPENVEEDNTKIDAKPSTGSLASPFGFTSAGGGLANQILGNEPAESEPRISPKDAVSGSSEKHDGAYGLNPSAAASRRARRLRADLPPPKEEAWVKYSKIIGTGLLLGMTIGSIGYFGRPYTSQETENGMKDDPNESYSKQVIKRYSSRLKSMFNVSLTWISPRRYRHYIKN